MQKLRIIFAGAGEFGLPTLRALLDAGHQVVQVVSQPSRPAGRGRKLTPTAIAQFALERGLPLVQTDNINDENLPLPSCDVMVVIAFGQKIEQWVVDRPYYGSVNLHSSRLPRHRGAAPINWAILSGDRITGNSIIRLAEKMDAGRILAMSELEIGETETAGELHDRLAADGAPLMLGMLEHLAAGRVVEVEQDHSKATLARKLSRESTKIDWTRSPQEIARTINGLSPWPGCRVKLVDAAGDGDVTRLTLSRAKPLPTTAGDPGVIRGDTVSGVQILEVQPEGKRPMPLAAYRNGHRWEDGLRVESLI